MCLAALASTTTSSLSLASWCKVATALSRRSSENHFQCPLRLQRMSLTLQKYSFQIKYKPGNEMFIADALSRFLSKEKVPGEEHFQVNVIQELTVSAETLQQIMRATNQDENFRTLRKHATTKWPEEKYAVPEQIRAYWP